MPEGIAARPILAFGFFHPLCSIWRRNCGGTAPQTLREGRPLVRMVFCNIGWMSRYRGLVGQPDNIVGGGRWVRENKTGHEVCNFLPCADGYVYGHVELIRGETDRQIRIENWGGGDDFLSDVNLVWTATHPDQGGRRIVGWYRKATIFRNRQHFEPPPSKQHSLDSIKSYRIRALAKDAYVLGLDDRTLVMPRGAGWMGQTAWWSPPDEATRDVRQFIRDVRQLVDRGVGATHVGKTDSDSGPAKYSPGTAKDPYVRYVQAHEIHIDPKHNELQSQFEGFLSSEGATHAQANLESVDLRYLDPRQGNVLVEIKPCERTNARYTIRMAMGQLLDYRQRTKGELSLLIVIEVEPNDQDRLLATANGFGIAYPSKGTFRVIWPTP